MVTQRGRRRGPVLPAHRPPRIVVIAVNWQMSAAVASALSAPCLAKTLTGAVADVVPHRLGATEVDVGALPDEIPDKLAPVDDTLSWT